MQLEPRRPHPDRRGLLVSARPLQILPLPTAVRQSKVTVKIPRPLYRKIQAVVDGSGFNSPTDFVVYVLRDLMGEHDPATAANGGTEKPWSEEELDEVKRKLKEMDWHDIAIMTRAGQAKVLGIVSQGKGHLGTGAEADIAIYPIRTDSVDPAREYRKVVEGFQKTRYTIKRGRVVSRDGEIIVDGANATFWANAQIPEDLRVDTDPEFIRRFQEYYTVRMSNYPVQDLYLPRGRRIDTEAFT